MSDCITMYIGLDVHKESIGIAAVDAGGGRSCPNPIFILRHPSRPPQ